MKLPTMRDDSRGRWLRITNIVPEGGIEDLYRMLSGLERSGAIAEIQKYERTERGHGTRTYWAVWKLVHPSG